MVHTFHAGSIRSAVRQSHSARARLVRWACPHVDGAQLLCDDGTIDPIAITDHITRSPSRKSLGDLGAVPIPP